MLENILYATAPLIAITNPIAELPVFLGIMAGRSRRDVNLAALKVAIGVWLILVLAAVGGLRILDLFGIQLPAFRAAGGLLLIVMGMEMLLGRETAIQHIGGSPDGANDALWVPLVMPMLAGPGSIVTAVTLSIRESTMGSVIPFATTAAVTIAATVVFLVLAVSAFLSARIGFRGKGIMSRFSGLILVAIGFQMGFTGTAEFFMST